MISEKTLTQTLETETSVSMNEIFLVSFKYPIDEIVVSSGHVLKAKRIYSQHTSAFLSSSNRFDKKKFLIIFNFVCACLFVMYVQDNGIPFYFVSQKSSSPKMPVGVE